MTMRAALVGLAVAAAGCQTLFPLEDRPDGAVDAVRTARRREITIEYGGSIPFADFPVSIVLEDDPDLAMHALPDGSDIRFTTEAGELEAEIVGYDGGTLDAWVRLPMLNASMPNTVWLEYGGAASADHGMVWDSAIYKAVWHLSGPSKNEEPDRSGHGYTATTGGATAPAMMTAGRAGLAREFALGDAAFCTGSDMMLGIESFSFAAWVKVPSDFPGPRGPLDAGGNLAEGFGLEVESAAWRARIRDSKGSSIELQQNVQLGDGAWHQLVAVYDRSGDPELRTYLDGGFLAKKPGTLDSVAARGTRKPCLGKTFLGALDEVRVYSVALDPQWIATEASNLANRETFVVIGDPQ